MSMTSKPTDQQDLNSRYIIDLAERVASTFAETFMAIWLFPVLVIALAGSEDYHTIWSMLTDLSVLNKAAVAGFAAVISMGKGLFARWTGSRNTAAILPYADDTPQP